MLTEWILLRIEHKKKEVYKLRLIYISTPLLFLQTSLLIIDYRCPTLAESSKHPGAANHLFLFVELGTLLDGEPIITLPPKRVDLMRIDFPTEERTFYNKLEADSRKQFKVCLCLSLHTHRTIINWLNTC